MEKMTEQEAAELDDFSLNYLLTKAETAHKTPAQVIGDLVREKIAASA